MAAEVKSDQRKWRSRPASRRRCVQRVREHSAEQRRLAFQPTPPTRFGSSGRALQLAMNAWRTRKWVIAADRSDQIADVGRDRRSANATPNAASCGKRGTLQEEL